MIKVFTAAIKVGCLTLGLYYLKRMKDSKNKTAIIERENCHVKSVIVYGSSNDYLDSSNIDACVRKEWKLIYKTNAFKEYCEYCDGYKMENSTSFAIDPNLVIYCNKVEARKFIDEKFGIYNFSEINDETDYKIEYIDTQLDVLYIGGKYNEENILICSVAGTNKNAVFIKLYFNEIISIATISLCCGLLFKNIISDLI